MRPPSRSGSTRPRRAAGEWLIGFGAVAGDASLSASGDLVEAAASLFDRLHEAERQRPAAHRGRADPRPRPRRAINDRLRRAAAPRR